MSKLKYYDVVVNDHRQAVYLMGDVDERIDHLEAEVENTFAHWHMHSHKNYLRWQKTLKRNTQLKAENEALQAELVKEKADNLAYLKNVRNALREEE